MIFFGIRSLAVASFLGIAIVGSTAPSSADVLTYTAPSNSIVAFYDGTETLNGSFTVDTTAGTLVSSSLDFTGPGSESALYSVPYSDQNNRTITVANLAENQTMQITFDTAFGPSSDFADFFLYTPYSSASAVNFTVAVASAVPEPSTWAMMLLGFCGLGYLGYRRRDHLALGAA